MCPSPNFENTPTLFKKKRNLRNMFEKWWRRLVGETYRFLRLAVPLTPTTFFLLVISLVSEPKKVDCHIRFLNFLTKIFNLIPVQTVKYFKFLLIWFVCILRLKFLAFKVYLIIFDSIFWSIKGIEDQFSIFETHKINSNVAKNNRVQLS